MKYAQVRNQIKTGDLLAFSTTKLRDIWDLLAWVVRLFGATEYSHVGFAWVEHGRVWVVEATRHGVYPMLLSKKGGEFYWIKSDRLYKEHLDRAFSKVGLRYGWWDAIKAGFRSLVIGDNAVWQCAEFYLWVKGITGVNPTPADVVEHALLAGAEMVKVEIE